MNSFIRETNLTIYDTIKHHNHHDHVGKDYGKRVFSNQQKKNENKNGYVPF